MVNTVIETVMNAPRGQQLEYALEFLRTLTGEDAVEYERYMDMGLTRTEGRMMNYMVTRAGNICTKEQLVLLCGEDVEIKIVDVFICKIRQKIGNDKVETIWGEGYRVSKEVAIEMTKETLTRTTYARTPKEKAVDGSQVPLRGRAWTEQEREDLVTMLESESSTASIAFELQRTERSVVGQIAFLKKKGAFDGEYERQRDGAYQFMIA